MAMTSCKSYFTYPYLMLILLLCIRKTLPSVDISDVSRRSVYCTPAIMLIDQLKEIYVDGQLEPIDTAQWLSKVMRKDCTVALNLTGNGLDDPDQTLYENFTCGAEGNYDGYCNPELDKMVDRQSREFDQTN